MSQMVEDAQFGNVILTTNAVSKMNKFGLQPFHVFDTLKHGFKSACTFNDEFLQFNYTFDQMKQVSVVVTDKNKDGKPLGTIIVITLWARNIR